jgi:uncharacterized membrane protein SpoIIM required for sporulation
MIRLRSYEFRREREAGWRELESLLSRIDEVGIRGLSARELSQLPLLHRSALSSLSVARAISLDRNLMEYLESLAARAHFAVYGTRRGLFEAATGFFGRDFPAAVRSFRVHVLLAALFLVAGIYTAAAMTRQDPERFYAFVSSDYAQGRDPSASTQELRDQLYSTRRGATEQLTLFASVLFTHNARIGMLSFALGFAAGLPVFLLLFSNGLILGAFAELHRSRGLGADFWGWILPHGVTELLALILCGAAGLAVAESLVFPGRHARLHNLALRGREAGKVVLGAVCMFLIAGLIEGFFRQLEQSLSIRFAVASFYALFWAVYFGRPR